MSMWKHGYACALVLAVSAAFSLPAATFAVDCNNNGIEDDQDIANATSEDCDLNGVPDECQPDTNNNGVIDACDSCGLQITDTTDDEQWSVRQSSTSQGTVLWFDIDDSIHFYDGAATQLVQPRVVNAVDLEAVANFVFGLGEGADPGEVIGAWRRGTDFAWVWTNDGQDPRPVNYVNPYDPTRAMNPEDVAIADGCVFMLMQASDPDSGNLALHVVRIDPATGDAALLTGDFLDVTQNAGGGAEVETLVTSDCKAAWSWCAQGTGGSCTTELELHYYDGTTTTVLDTDARALSFARGRLIYSKPVDGIAQLFLYDSNLPNPAPEQITAFEATDKQMRFAQTDGRNVAMLVADGGGLDREIVMLGGLALTDPATQPTDTPPKASIPFQLHRGQLIWTAQNTSVIYYDGQGFGTVCAYGWLADGYVAQLRRSSGTGDDSEVFLYTGTPPDDALQPSAPLLVQAEVTANNEITVSWSTVLGATAYNVYFAQQAGVTPANHATLPGGGTVAGVEASPVVLGGLAGDQLYYIVVTAVENGTEGPISREVSAMPCLDPSLDSDGDGTPDCLDLCPADPDKTDPGVCGCGVPDTDSDGDGTPDCVSLDLCPDDPDKTNPGVCGCGVPDTDTNNNGVPDCLEQVDGDQPEPPDDCAPALCGPGTLPVLPMMIAGLVAMRRVSRRVHAARGS